MVFKVLPANIRSSMQIYNWENNEEVINQVKRGEDVPRQVLNNCTIAPTTLLMKRAGSNQELSVIVQLQEYRKVRLALAGWILVIPYSGKLSREETFANFVVLRLCVKVFSAKFGGVVFFGAAKASNPRKFSLRKSIFHESTKVFSLKSFPLYGKFTIHCRCCLQAKTCSLKA